MPEYEICENCNGFGMVGLPTNETVCSVCEGKGYLEKGD